MVVLVYLPVAHIFLPFLAAVADARVGHLDAHLLVEEAPQRIGGVYPAVGVEYVFGDVLGVDAVDRVADVLPRGHDQTERDQQDDGDGVVQTEYRRVDVDIVHFNEILQSTKHV